MWPFSRRAKFQLPAWTFRPIQGEQESLRLSCGRWFVTDGGVLANSDEVGQVTSGDGSVNIERGPDGLESLSRSVGGEPLLSSTTPAIVIVSGCVGVCSESAFKKGGITLRTCGVLLRTAWKACPGADTVLIEDVAEGCVGIIVEPPFGDGAYRLQCQTVGDSHLLRIELAESC